MWIESASILRSNNSGEYSIDHNNQKINISYTLWKNYWISDVNMCFPSSELTQEEKVKLQNFKDNWYIPLWEYDENGNIPENLQSLLDSEFVEDYSTIKRTNPNKHLILWKVHFQIQNGGVIHTIKKSISQLLN